MQVQTHIPTSWFNWAFSSIVNCGISIPPFETSYKKDKFFFTKRDGLTEVFQADADIVQIFAYSNIIYFYDTAKNVYKWTKTWDDYNIAKIYTATNAEADNVTLWEEDFDGSEMSQQIFSIPYVVDKVSTATVDWVATVSGVWEEPYLVVNEDTFTSADLGRYVYIPDTSENAKYQIREILEVESATKVLLNFSFYNVPSDWDTVEIYDRVWDTIVFNNLRKSDNDVLTFDLDDDKYFRHYWGRQTFLYDWKLWILNNYWTSLGWSLWTGENEILDPATVLWFVKDNKAQKIISAVPYAWNVVLFYDNKVSAVWRVWEWSDWEPIYTLRDVLQWIGIKTVESFDIREWGLYFLSANNRFYGLALESIDERTLQGRVKNQWFVIQELLDKYSDWDNYYIYSDSAWLNILIAYADKTYVLKYLQDYEWWAEHRYNKKLKKYFKNYLGKEVMIYWDKLAEKWGEDDIWEEIEQYVEVTWPDEVYGNMFVLHFIKLMLWYYWEKTDCNIRVETSNWIYEWYLEHSASGSQWVSYQEEDWSLGNNSLGYWVLWWWEDISVWNTTLLGLKLRAWWVYYKIKIGNKDNNALNIWLIQTLYSPANTLTVPKWNYI